ncbi:DUF4271 domain-containing protein [Aegicerativicinus sediminis]|uniref:DUF4271 domain-containing protein n=1 Tax=Aegicerativicinus sediminis TaxID=2893202 RepID=UPI001E4C0685|nr:DUF4271 domain-containing protein [Aegicerativicinus sediminis]
MLRETISNEWFTASIVVALGLITLAKFLYSYRFHDFLAVITNSKYLKIYIREQKFFDTFDTLLYINLIISAAIFGYIALGEFVDLNTFNPEEYLKILIGFGAIVVIKIMIERLVGSMFEIDGLIDSYLFQKTTYKNYSGLILLAANILMIYTITPSKTIILIVFGILFLINLNGFLTTLKNHQNLLFSNFFYFILYLCALEIGPYILLYEFISAQKA